MKEPIEKALVLAGISLDFGKFKIQGIPGFNVSSLRRGEQSVYEIEVQNFSFQISTKDFVNHQIKEDFIFTMSDEIYQYRFMITRSLNDLTGWTKLFCDHREAKEV